jgi:diphthamide synthase (EF-2-diphthine--ammonia ligase)
MSFFLAHELDSYMYQTVGHTAISLYAEAMGLPLFRGLVKLFLYKLFFLFFFEEIMTSQSTIREVLTRYVFIF